MQEAFLRRFACLFVIVALIFAQLAPSLAQTINSGGSDNKAPESIPAKTNFIPSEDAIGGELDFYSGDFVKAASLFDTFALAKDKDFALWNNQRGSIYLAAGDYKQALSAFLDAYYLMNDTSAFSSLESHAVALTGEEREKAYKGDPYERVYNSIYVAFLLDQEHDYDNALAAVKTGILCDSDVQGGLYKSDVTLLYLLGARFALLTGNASLSDEYLQKAQDAYLLSHPTNRGVVSDEQAKLIILNEKQKDLDKLLPKELAPEPKKEEIAGKEGQKTTGQNFASKKNKDNNPASSPKESKKVTALKEEIKQLENEIAKFTAIRMDNNKRISADILKQVVDLRNNVLFVIELGRSPIKYPIGQYGQIAVFTSKPFKASKIKIAIDKKSILDERGMLCHNDTTYQALTRGGRMMDCILKGKAQFKETTGQISQSLAQMSQQMANSSGGMQQSYAAAGMAVLSLAFAIGSAMANPAADVRHWSLLPAELRIIPASLPVGLHNIQLQAFDSANNQITELCKEFEVNIKDGENIIIKRIVE